MGFGFVSRRAASPSTCAVLCASWMLLASAVAVAQPAAAPTAPVEGTAAAPTAAEPPPTTAQEWFRRGETVYRVGQYQEAIDAWQRAYELDPRPRIQYNLAQAYERQGRLEDAVAALEHYLANGDPADQVYADANARLAGLRQRVASTGVVLHGGPSGGAITIDGQEWGLTPRPDRIGLAPGSHLIEIQYGDGRAFRSTVATPAGQVVQVEIRDADITVPQIVTVAARREPPSRVTLYAGIGMAAVGVGFLGYGIERQVKVGHCQDASNYCANLSTGQTERTVGLAVGGTLTAAGVALIVVDLLRQRSYQRSTALTCAPLLAGATCRLRF